jgi:hypothetical protein
MPNITAKLKEIEANCPTGYSVAFPGQTIDMLGSTELWRIHEHHAEPHLTRVPQDLVPDVMGSPCAARVPKEWGRCLYYKII